MNETQTHTQPPKRIVIIGGVAGGASAAARARRLSEAAEITLVERGEHISFANCGLPYHIGGTIAERARLLVQTPEAMRRRFRIDVRTRTEAVAIDRERRAVRVRNLMNNTEEELPYDALILSPGAAPIRPPLPGGDSPRVLTLRNLADMDAIKRIVDEERPQNTVVIGGGYIGLEMAEALRQRQVGVTLVELGNQVMGPADPEMATPLHQQLTLHGVDLRLETSVSALRELDGALEAQLSTGETVEAALVIMAIGVKPETGLARTAGLAIGERGGIVVDAQMRTSDPAIYAVGDAVQVQDFVTGAETLIPLAGPANRQGRIAADNIFGRASTYKRTQGTAICKVFDTAIAMTGLSEKAARRAGVAYEKVYVHPTAHAGYYPGAAPLSLKLLFDPQSGKVLGAQAVGPEGADKRIDVLAVAIRAGLTVFDLEELELSYAPPYGSAKDPINYAGFVAANALRGDVKLCHVADVLAPKENQLILDVRTPVEFQAGAIPGAVNIPLDDLRERLGELPREKELLVNCQVGLRGYLACRILAQHGFTCRNLSGGYKTYLMVTQKPAKPAPGNPASPSPSPSPSPSQSQSSSNLPHSAFRIPHSDNPRSASSAMAQAGEDAHAPRDSALRAPLKTIDASGLQCPGPIMRLAEEVRALAAGETVAILARDPGFAADVAGWCRSTGNRLLGVTPEDGRYRAIVEKGAQAHEVPVACSRSAAPAAPALPSPKNKTIVVFSNDFDKMVAAFIIANGAAAMGSNVTLFFTFWGLNALRRPEAVAVRKSLVEKMFGWMMPRGPERLTLSKMNMGGMGLGMIKGIMKKKNVDSLPTLIAKARAAGVRLVACAMSMDLMGIKKEELIDGVELGGVAMYLSEAEAGTVNLFV
jgi:NADPH-dependent 2,4-dienoyl-CoA reductase/sulfur reductase-like enzyme/peroxiredoxin family protein/rhodanese-related sulfurtransferase/TusA-related sulfurtransferase